MSTTMDSWMFDTEVLIPKYEDVEHKGWKYTTVETAPAKGYFTPFVFNKDVRVLKHERRLWMSTTTMETESHVTPVSLAHGKVFIAGLGMGVALYNIALKPEVTAVHVAEINQDAIDAFLKSSKMNETWPKEIVSKITIAQGDAFERQAPDVKFDFLYLDIWECMNDHKIPDEVHVIADLYPEAKGVTFWTQELTMCAWMNDNYHDTGDMVCFDEVWEEFAHEYIKCSRLLGPESECWENLPDLYYNYF